jgi:hypothetical protein
MTADQAQAAPALLDLELAAMGLASVPDFLSPVDGNRDVRASLDLGLDQAPAPRVAPEDWGMPWPRQFAVLLAETLAGARPLQQVLPLMSERGSTQLRRLLPLFCGDYRPRVLRVLTAAPSPGVIEMAIVVTVGPRTRALAVRLERAARAAPAWRVKPATPWRCTDIEAG